MKLSAKNVSVSYDGTEVLRDVSMDVRPGELTVIIGPNGAGKTTFLRCLNGAVEPTGGAVELDGQRVGSIPRRRIAREITTVAQENETRFPVTVHDYALGGRFVWGGTFGWESESDHRIVRECLDLCGIGEFGPRLMNELSGGERQRVLLARAFASQASILLLDEPTNNLDIANQVLVLKLVRERCDSCESAAVVVTHDLNLAAAFADRLILLKDGHEFDSGSPSEVLREDIIERVFGLNVSVDVVADVPRISTLY